LGLNASENQVLGCLVTDIQTGESIGWVKNLIFDQRGEQVTELLVDRRARPQREGEERSEGLVGRPLFDSQNRYLGEIVDMVIGSETGKLHGLMVERSPGRQDFLPAFQGLVWEQDHWVLMPERPQLRSTMFPHEAFDEELAFDAEDDWMVGQVATVRLLDRRGHVIVEPGQRITPSVVEQASKAGVLHKLEAEFPEEGR
jgi:sporulation protein YlmC with PRC-barrel domain